MEKKRRTHKQWQTNISSNLMSVLTLVLDLSNLEQTNRQ